MSTDETSASAWDRAATHDASNNRLMTTTGFPAVRLVRRKAGASYTGRPCASCCTIFARDTRIVVAKERGNYMADGWQLYHRVCHPSFNESQIDRFVAQLSRQIVVLTDN